MNQQEILAIFTQTHALLEGHFKLSSGRHADKYIQCARVLQHPAHARMLGSELAQPFHALNPSVVVAPAMGGLIIGHEVAAALGCRFIFTERENSQMTLRRGFDIQPGEGVIIVEDVVTTGTSTREVIDVVQSRNGDIRGIACLVNRATGFLDLLVPLHTLLKLTFSNWDPHDCPLCRQSIPIDSPGSRYTK
ncbi:orotate phosphoribosyltransferase [bacterium]|nr:orotate phosphoribosyltransferase [candidate division CSSED10-310 bacterium]